MQWLLALILGVFAAESGGTLDELSRALRDAELDPEACFRVRDFSFRRNGVRLYLTDGIVMLRKPVNGIRTGAIFVASEDLEDAEMVMIPPNRMERKSLASFTGSPNLNEHFRAAAFLFTDGTGERWFEELSQSPTVKKSPERGVLIAERWNGTMRNLSVSLATRIMEDMINGAGRSKGFFFAAVSGRELGNFDLYFDPRSREELLVGQLENLDGRSRYNFWVHFEPKRPEARSPIPVPAIIERYEVKAEIGDDLRFHAVAKLTLRGNEDGLKVLPLDLSPRLRIKSARWNGQEIEVYQREALRANLLRSADSEGVLVRLPTPLKRGTVHVLEIEEEGDIFVRAGNGVLYLATRASWFPQIQLQAAPFEARFEHARSQTLVCPGVRSESVVGDRKVTRCRVDQPVRLFGFNLGEFQSTVVKRGGLEVEVYANKLVETALEQRAPMLPPQPLPGPRRRPELPSLTIPTTTPSAVSRTQVMADEIGGALEFFAAAFGPPPLRRVVAAPIPGSFGQGFPGFLYLSTLAYLEDGKLPTGERAEWQGRNFREILQAHEVAHQWWGNLVTFENYRDEWMGEALASYSALMYLEKKKGTKALDAQLDAYKRRVLSDGEDGKALEAAGPLVFGMRLRYSNPRAWQAVIYEKSAWVLHMLRGRMGDAAFLKMLGQLTHDFSTKPMTTDDLRRAAAANLPKDSVDRDLESFFENWVYGTGVPHLELTSSVRGVAPRARVELRLKQTRVAEDFAVDVPVEIEMPRGQKIIKWIRSGAEEEIVEVATGAVPLKVVLDPRNILLRR